MSCFQPIVPCLSRKCGDSWNNGQGGDQGGKGKEEEGKREEEDNEEGKEGEI